MEVVALSSESVFAGALSIREKITRKTAEVMCDYSGPPNTAPTMRWALRPESNG